jgi:predicted transcriptional regulator
MSVQILEQLFDSPIKVRIFKLFLRNPNDIFKLSEIADKTQFKKAIVRKQIKGLEEIGFLKKRKIKSKKKGMEKEPGVYYYVNQGFDFYSELRNLVLKSSPASIDMIFKYIKRLGRVKLAILAGVFMNEENSRLDLFLVGDGIAARKLSNFLKNLEAEVGKTIDYSVLTLDDFNYRFSMFDRFILDILEKPHRKLINKLRI